MHQILRFFTARRHELGHRIITLANVTGRSCRRRRPRLRPLGRDRHGEEVVRPVQPGLEGDVGGVALREVAASPARRRSPRRRGAGRRRRARGGRSSWGRRTRRSRGRRGDSSITEQGRGGDRRPWSNMRMLGWHALRSTHQILRFLTARRRELRHRIITESDGGGPRRARARARGGPGGRRLPIAGGGEEELLDEELEAGAAQGQRRDLRLQLAGAARTPEGRAGGGGRRSTQPHLLTPTPCGWRHGRREGAQPGGAGAAPQAPSTARSRPSTGTRPPSTRGRQVATRWHLSQNGYGPPPTHPPTHPPHPAL